MAVPVWRVFKAKFPLLSFITSRILTMIVILFILGWALFGLMGLAPGDIVDQMMQQQLMSQTESRGGGSERSDVFSEEQLAKALFPIGELTKPEVRRIAREADLPSADKKDSQGICFVGKVDLPVFLQQQLKSVEGDVVEVFAPYYADSAKYHQRKGLGSGGHASPMFVLATDVRQNVIYVGEGEGHPGLLRSCLRINPEEIHWIRPDQAMQAGEERRYLVRIRYRQPLQDATLLMRGNGLYVRFDQPQRSITPGQFAVWYAPDGEMLGSGGINA